MENHELAESAARVIAAKARRLAAAGNFDAARLAVRQQRSRALLQIAAQLSPAHAQAAAQASGGESVAITPEDRRAAANEIYALLQRRSGNDVVLLYDIALELHYESYWAYLRGIQLSENGDPAAACQALEAVRGDYEGAATHLAEQYRRQAAGIPDELEDAAQQLYERMVEEAGSEDALHKSFNEMWASVSGMPPPEGDDGENEEIAVEVNLADVDLAAETGQCFVEHLVDGDFDGATALLGESLRDLSADELRREYEQLIEAGRDGEEAVENEEIDVLPMSSDSEIVDLEGGELALVYVSLNGAGFHEAVIVTVAREHGQARITSIEWGRT
ncbi:hypothetical protein [Tahibacter harae]|uniref:Uncharacterized protein n=1 Tax=Tahibacter harae TaxID=2963937 RepID=A0ABT1QUJ8_9GAMM|nr:hypothetical protein [Tahibacter harae]MCQ4165965.1 hypothetical protein [Tahibacter harae]